MKLTFLWDHLFIWFWGLFYYFQLFNYFIHLMALFNSNWSFMLNLLDLHRIFLCAKFLFFCGCPYSGLLSSVATLTYFTKKEVRNNLRTLKWYDIWWWVWKLFFQDNKYSFVPWENCEKIHLKQKITVSRNNFMKLFREIL